MPFNYINREFALPNATIYGQIPFFGQDSVDWDGGTVDGWGTLYPGTEGQVLTISSGLPSWQTAASGGTPAGVNADVQFNNNGSFGIASDFVTDWKFFYDDWGGDGEWFWGDYNTWNNFIEWYPADNGYMYLYHQNPTTSSFGEVYIGEGSASLTASDDVGSGGVYEINTNYLRMGYTNVTTGDNNIYLNSTGAYLSNVSNAGSWTDLYLVTKGFSDTSYTTPTYVADRYVSQSKPFELLDSMSHSSGFAIGVWVNSNKIVFAAQQTPGIISYSVDNNGQITALDTFSIRYRHS